MCVCIFKLKARCNCVAVQYRSRDNRLSRNKTRKGINLRSCNVKLQYSVSSPERKTALSSGALRKHNIDISALS